MPVTIFTNEQLEKQNVFRNFVRQSICPLAEQWDVQESFSLEIIQQCAKQGYLGATLPNVFSGTGMDPVTFGLLCEELGKGSISLISLLTVHGMAAQSILRWGNSALKDTYLPVLARGEKIAAFALSEPEIGSDPRNVQTTAVKTADGYLLSGQKKWISCGQLADLYLVVAQMEGKPTAFLVDRTASTGLEVIPMKGLSGFRSAMLAELVFQDAFVPATHLVGKEGLGFSHVANTALDYGRYCVAWGCVGLAQACLEACLEYTSHRKQFGVALRKHQLIQEMVAEMTTNIRAARALCLQAAELKQRGEPNSIMETSIAKYFASKIAFKCANDAVQIHGANGCHSDYPVARYFRDAKITEIIEGSTQIQQIIIAQHAYQQFLFSSRSQRSDA